MFSPRLNISISSYRINAFLFFGILGFILGTLLGTLLTIYLHLDPAIILLMSLTGAIVFFLLTYITKWITGAEVIVYYHHEIAILLACWLVLSLINAPVLNYLDITIIGIGVFLGFGRLGCFSVGCCHGRPFKNGVAYGEDHVHAGFTWYFRNVKLLPVQLIESSYVFLNVIIGILLLFFEATPGTVLVSYTVIYGCFRYTLEFFRGDATRPLWLGLSEAQWTTLCLVAITYGMSQAGLLPEYSWHMVILFALAAVSIYVVFYYRKQRSYALLTARHIKEIAEGLEILSKANEIETKSQPLLHLFTTKQGLSISLKTYPVESFYTAHCTLSMQTGSRLNESLVKKISLIINQIKGSLGNAEIIPNGQGIYHILFSSDNLKEEKLKHEVA
jgi:prolipoprotein diacylglyceryltransferase